MKLIRPDEVLLVLLHLHRDVDDLLVGVRLPLRAPRPLEVPEAPVHVPQLLVRLLELRVVVDVARIHLEVRPHERLLEDGQTLELQLPHPVLRPLRHRDLELHQLDRLLLGGAGLVRVGDLRLPDPGRHVPVVEVEVLDPPPVPPRVLLAPQPLVLGVGRLAPQPGEAEEARLLDLLHLPAQGPVGEDAVAVEDDLVDLRLWPLVDDEGKLLARPPDVLGLVLDRAEGPALLGQHLLDDPLDLAGLLGVVEGVDLDLGVPLLELVLDRAGGELLAAAEVHDLDALPLGHLETHHLAVRAVHRLDLEVVEEAGVPQPAEVVAELPLVVGVPRLRRDVEEERLLLEVLVVEDLDPLDDRRWLRRLRPRHGRRDGQQQPGPEDRRPRPSHADNAPPLSPCWYHSPPSSTPTSIGRPPRICPRMNASDSGSSMWRWIARRSGRAP